MTHYQKLATMIFRIIGFFLMLYCIVFSIVFTFQVVLFKGDSFSDLLTLSAYKATYFAYIVYFIIGFGLFIISPNLAKWVCFDFEKTDDK